MNYIINLIYEHGVWAMFFIILIEYACFPISSEIVLPFSGAVASVQNVNYFVIVLLSILAGIIGTTFCFFIGRLGGTALIEAVIRKFPKAESGLTSSQEKFKKYGGFAVCFGRLIPLCRTYIAFIAGASGQNPVVYIISSLVGISIWNSILIGLGYIMRENWSLASGYYDRYKDVITPLLALAALFIISHVRGKKESKN